MVLVQWPNSRILFRIPTIRARYIYTRGTCSKSKFYLRTMRGKVLSRSTGLRGGYEHPKRTSNAHVPPLSLSHSLPPFSIPCRVRSTPAKTKFNCDRAKGLFFSFFSFLYVANLPCAGRNKRQCTASPLSARACIRGERVCVCR